MTSLPCHTLHLTQRAIGALETLQLLALGLFGRFAAAGLFVVNAAAVTRRAPAADA